MKKPVISEREKSFKKSVIGDGEESWTETHVFEDCYYVVRATAKVYYIVIDKEKEEQVKDQNINFRLRAVGDIDEMDFVRNEEE